MLTSSAGSSLWDADRAGDLDAGCRTGCEVLEPCSATFLGVLKQEQGTYLGGELGARPRVPITPPPRPEDTAGIG